MEKIRQINIKNRTHHFYNDQIALKDVDAMLLKIDKKKITKTLTFILVMCQFKQLLIATNNINIVNRLYLMIDQMIGHVEEKNENKYLALDDVDENKEIVKKYKEVWDGIKKEIETINGREKIEYGKN